MLRVYLVYNVCSLTDLRSPKLSKTPPPSPADFILRDQAVATQGRTLMNYAFITQFLELTFWLHCFYDEKLNHMEHSKDRHSTDDYLYYLYSFIWNIFWVFYRTSMAYHCIGVVYYSYANCWSIFWSIRMFDESSRINLIHLHVHIKMYSSLCNIM